MKRFQLRLEDVGGLVLSAEYFAKTTRSFGTLARTLINIENSTTRAERSFILFESYAAKNCIDLRPIAVFVFRTQIIYSIYLNFKNSCIRIIIYYKMHIINTILCQFYFIYHKLEYNFASIDLNDTDQILGVQTTWSYRSGSILYFTTKKPVNTLKTANILR